MDDALKKYSSRKLWLVILCQIMITTLLCYALIPVTMFESLTWLFIGGYLGSNVAQKVFVKEDK